MIAVICAIKAKCNLTCLSRLAILLWLLHGSVFTPGENTFIPQIRIYWVARVQSALILHLWGLLRNGLCTKNTLPSKAFLVAYNGTSAIYGLLVCSLIVRFVSLAFLSEEFVCYLVSHTILDLSGSAVADTFESSVYIIITVESFDCSVSRQILRLLELNFL